MAVSTMRQHVCSQPLTNAVRVLGAIATSQPLATAAGLAILQQGGNAIDAAVTAAAVLNVVELHMTRMGGDLFALFWSAREGRMVGLDASGRAGALMTRDRILMAATKQNCRGGLNKTSTGLGRPRNGSTVSSD